MLTEGKFTASNRWIEKFKKRKGLSVQKKTNKKSTSVHKRLPKVKNFHWWAIYQMRTEDP